MYFTSIKSQKSVPLLLCYAIEWKDLPNDKGKKNNHIFLLLNIHI